MERRSNPRAHLGTIFLNKYIDGFPHLVKLVDVSAGGMLVRKVHEPQIDRDFFTVELGVPGRSERMWLWTRRVWENGKVTALRFVGIDPIDRARLTKLVRDAREASS
jgi:hypothetical protein